MDYILAILVAFLLCIGLFLGPIHMMLVYHYCPVTLRGDEYGYLQYYDEFLEIWNTVPCYYESGESLLKSSFLYCKTKEELEAYKKKFKTIDDINAFVDSEEKKRIIYEENKRIYL